MQRLSCLPACALKCHFRSWEKKPGLEHRDRQGACAPSGTRTTRAIPKLLRWWGRISLPPVHLSPPNSTRGWMASVPRPLSSGRRVACFRIQHICKDTDQLIRCRYFILISWNELFSPASTPQINANPKQEASGERDTPKMVRSLHACISCQRMQTPSPYQVPTYSNAQLTSEMGLPDAKKKPFADSTTPSPPSNNNHNH